MQHGRLTPCPINEAIFRIHSDVLGGSINQVDNADDSQPRDYCVGDLLVFFLLARRGSDP